MNRCIAIFGPTASGKSSLAIKLAVKLDGVIISADSMQIYKVMNIGTAKPTKEEMSIVPHKMIDICSPLDSFSVYDYKKRAENEIENALANGKVPIIVGGTGLYFDALFYNTQFGEMDIDPKIHDLLVSRSENGENKILLEELRKVDPICAEKLHEKDTKRIIRALEVYLSTGKTLTEFKEKSKTRNSKFDYKKIFLDFSNRDLLYQRINDRVDQMISEGLLQETKNLLENGYLKTQTAAQAIGYKEIVPFLEGEKSLSECIDLLKQKTRNYAKRQLTWFRRYDDSHRIEIDRNPDFVQTALKICQNYLKGE